LIQDGLNGISKIALEASSSQCSQEIIALSFLSLKYLILSWMHQQIKMNPQEIAAVLPIFFALLAIIRMPASLA